LSLRFAAALWYYWALRSRYIEGRRWLELALANARAVGAGPPRVWLAKALTSAGRLAEKHGDAALAQALLGEALPLHRELGDDQGAATALLYLGRAARDRGDYAQAEALERESLALFSELGTNWGVSWALFSLGDAALDQGDTDRATALFEESLALCRTLAENNGIAVSLMNLGRVAYAQMNLARAAELLEQSLALFREQGSPLGAAEALHNLGRVAQALGDDARAAMCSRESLALLREQGSKHMVVAACLEGLAGVAGAWRQPELAALLFGAAEALRDTIAVPLRPVSRAEYDRDLARARTQLDALAWQAAWGTGRAMSLEQAIAEAERVSPEPQQAVAPVPAVVFPRLTPRERQVIALIARGYSNRAIGEALVITERTAEIHVGNILGKLGFSSRTQVAAYAVAEGLVNPQDA
jgi:ATP/maltotriose-dependent transcriptional regulator MalT